MPVTHGYQAHPASASAVLPDYAALEQALPSLTNQEAQSLKRLLGPVTDEVAAWCEKHDFISPRSILPVSTVIIVQHAGLSAEAICLVVQTVLWITAADDLFDGQALSEPDLSRIIADCLQVACYPDARASHPYAAALKELRDSLATRTTWPPLQAPWAAALTQVFDGSMYEYWMNRRFSGQSTNPSFPTFEEYFSFSRLSIGLAFLWLTGIIAEDRIELIPHVPDLLAFAAQCANALRLTNDLATYQRERREGTLNSVLVHAVQLRREKPGLTWQGAETEALQLVERARAAAMERARIMAAALATPSGIQKRLLRGLELGTEIYALRDVREWAPQSTQPTYVSVTPSGERS